MQHGSGVQGRAAVSIAALGVVFGDIGTSPIYALRESFSTHAGLPVSPANILGVLSLVFWSLTMIISIKYALFILRADNKGEGGILALGTLALSTQTKEKGWGQNIMLLAIIFGGALLYGDGVITPAISVLSAVEGLNVATPAFDPYVVPITTTILIALFSVQKFGTKRIGSVFGPVMLIWFLTIGVLGLSSIIEHPGVLVAIHPKYAISMFIENHSQSFLVLGTVFLALTGGEAMYADLGHFGKIPIRYAWYLIAMPALLLNYFGQGALLITDPSMAENPFFQIAPRWALMPLVGLATMATVIASQALISGVFSLTRQAIRLGYCPRMSVVHTSEHNIGQIYLPAVNWTLLIATLWLVVTFGSSTRLAAAYGVAVSLTMLITTVLVVFVARNLWKWSALVTAIVFLPFFLLDLSFVFSNGVKIPAGGWIALVIAAVVMMFCTTWIKGRKLLAAALGSRTVPFVSFLAQLAQKPLPRVPGTAVFMTGNLQGTPFALINNIRHNKVLHERVVFLTIITTENPHMPPDDRVSFEVLAPEFNFHRILVKIGFMDEISVLDCFEKCKAKGFFLDLAETTFFMGREVLLAEKTHSMSLWRQKLFVFMARNAQNAVGYFDIPASAVVEIGMQVDAIGAPKV